MKNKHIKSSSIYINETVVVYHAEKLIELMNRLVYVE